MEQGTQGQLGVEAYSAATELANAHGAGGCCALNSTAGSVVTMDTHSTAGRGGEAQRRLGLILYALLHATTTTTTTRSTARHLSEAPQG